VLDDLHAAQHDGRLPADLAFTTRTTVGGPDAAVHVTIGGFGRPKVDREFTVEALVLARSVADLLGAYNPADGPPRYRGSVRYGQHPEPVAVV
jgi:hypothetical protein